MKISGCVPYTRRRRGRVVKVFFRGPGRRFNLVMEPKLARLFEAGKSYTIDVGFEVEDNQLNTTVNISGPRAR